MQLKDFYFADRHAAGTKMPIMLPSGVDSGEWLQVQGPDCDASVQAGRAYTAAVRQLTIDLESLEKDCAARDDYARYNDAHGYRIEELNKQMALEIVTGWSFDEPFTSEAFAELLRQFRGLATAVVVHHTKSREELSVK